MFYDEIFLDTAVYSKNARQNTLAFSIFNFDITFGDISTS